ncbi:hypothetical protein PRIPAC_96989 [Pristionchus pacificus]|uniref:Uncharacterized protein n=1 Tax=Pristionchus pacificus TaxID=54126 RepID=A0A2A6D0R4_PRIPA|nr:hypothetical protein PRIPAC_96989 [Pristionchus pacificus]|eukprot:PDM83979.1 hypothetical protein PRIPAC_34171 [Pristionchus pacificus]
MSFEWPVTDKNFLADESRRLSSITIDTGTTKPSIKVLDQLLLPGQKKYLEIKGVESAADLIKKMQVRGAPLIASVAVFGLCMESFQNAGANFTRDFMNNAILQLISTRPTAVNLRNVMNRLLKETAGLDGIPLIEAVRGFSFKELIDEARDNRQLCWNGVQTISSVPRKNPDGYTIMTICNTGSLATTSWGTALGVISGLHDQKMLRRVICLETRPYNQGSRLTATELSHQGIDFRLICDSMAAYSITEFQVDAIIVGADRVVANGDTANKVGTFNLAIVAKYFNIPFFVALPYDTFDFDTEDGNSIIIEQRKDDEMRYFNGSLICEPRTPVFNPAFDVTKADLISGYITEKGFHTTLGLKLLHGDEMMRRRAAMQ